MEKFAVYLTSLLLTFTFQGCSDLDQEMKIEDISNTDIETEVIIDDINKEADNSDLSFEVELSPETNNLTNNEMKKMPETGDKIATLHTNKGDIKLFLYSSLAPETVKNFEELAKSGKYNGVIFHRIIEDFMIQTGDFENANGTGGYSYKGEGTVIADEFGEGLSHLKGAVSMANAGPNTGGSQFFIVQKEDGTDWLDGHHAIFGFVYEGLDVVDQIAEVETDYMDKPTDDIVIESVELGVY